MTVLEPLAFPMLTAKQVEQFRAEGYLVVREALPVGVVSALRSHILRVLETLRMPALRSRSTSQYLSGSPIDQLCGSPRLHALAESLLGGPVVPFLHHTDVLSEGTGELSMHQDNMYTRIDGDGLACWFTCDRSDITSGCLQVQPGSHLQGDMPYEIYDGWYRRITTLFRQPSGSYLALELGPGDLVCYSRRLLHGSTSNMSARERVGYLVEFVTADATYRVDGRRVRVAERPPYTTGPVVALDRRRGWLIPGATPP